MLHEFLVVFGEWERLLHGFWQTIWLAVGSAAAALVLAMPFAMALMSRNRAIAVLARILVDGMRCVPFLLFAYFIYYGLPSLGIRFSSVMAGLIALILYNTAYMAELLRAAWANLAPEAIEAGHAFGFHGWGLFRRIVLPPVVLQAVPMIGNQVIQIVKDSAFLTIITVPELTHVASAIQAEKYVPFASFVTAIFLYWVICFAVELVVNAVGRVAEARR
ncbi:amino acid ABC transporter permease [Zavarzinia sp. CC-PAN008]|uniref:amino acid ABC transporter permease n=1 Tax=Zavarzinia sp. CC-PAN008 TaxID=3243332 RepID=UPI003F745366